MKIPSPSLLFAALLPFDSIAGDWPAWRGPDADGKAAPGERVPLTWSESENIAWRAPVPGRGHSTPVIFGDRIFLTTADEEAQTQSVLCLARRDGKRLWQTEVNRGGFPERIHRKNTHATPTPSCDGERVFVTFFHHGGIHLSALDLEGAVIWSKRCGGFESRYPYGYGASPLLHGNHVIVASEFENGGFLAAFDRVTGEERWRSPRTETTNFSSPIVAKVAGREQLLLSGAGLVSAWNPETGKPLWSTKAGPRVTAGTMIWEDELVFASGGFPEKETVAVRADGSGGVVWRTGVRCYEQSMLVHEGHVYAVDDGGIVHCWEAKTGTRCWAERIGGPVSASPVLVNGAILAPVERGVTFVFAANPERFELLSENGLGDESFASPVVCDGRIYLRVGHYEGEKRREILYCIGETGD